MKLIREFDDFGWAKSNLVNPWILGYTGIDFDVEPTRENLNELIEMALSLKMLNANKWGKDIRENDIDNLMDYFHSGGSYLGIDFDHELGYGKRKGRYGWDNIKWIEYSKLIDNGLNENKKDDGFGWAREIPLTFDENHQPSVGDVLVCLPGYQSYSTKYTEMDDPNCAGKGYADGRIIVVGEVVVFQHLPEGKRIVVWPDIEASERYWDYADDDVCFDCGVYGFALTYYTDTLTESDEDNDLDWIINTDPNIPVHFNNVVVGRTYRVEPTEVLLQAIEACNGDTHMYNNIETAYVKQISYRMPYDDIFCDSDRSDEVIGLRLEFYGDDGSLSGSFWVTDDMVNLYEHYGKLTENTEEEWSWAKDIEPGIKLETNTLYYFEPKLTVDEIEFFGNNISNAPKFKEWLLDIPNRNSLVRTDGGITYFITKPDLPIRVEGFCTETNIDYARIIYPGVKVVDARQTFNI